MHRTASRFSRLSALLRQAVSHLLFGACFGLSAAGFITGIVEYYDASARCFLLAMACAVAATII
jgi:hypothetical protein